MSLPTRGTDHRLLDPQLLHHPPPIIHAHVHQHLLLVLLLLLILGGLGCDHGQNCLLAHDLALLHQEGHKEHVLNTSPEAGGAQHKPEVVDGASAHLPELGDEAHEHMHHHLPCLVLRLLPLRQHGGSCLLKVRHLGYLPGLGVLGLLLLG